MKVQELALKAVESMIANGYKPITAWDTYENVLKHVVIEHARQDTDEYSEKAVSAYAKDVKRRYNNKEISYSHYRFLIGSVEKFINFEKEGTWRKPIQGHKPQINRFFAETAEALAIEFTEESNWTRTTKSMYMGCICKHFLWLESIGHFDFRNINGEIVQNYFVYLLNSGCSGRTILGAKGYLRRTYERLHEKKMIAVFPNFFQFHIPVEKRILPPVPQSETAKVLSLIDRATPKGKRDYAIILLAAVTGMRASDILNLRLKDICWEEGEIRLVQQKTGQISYLPLTTDVGVALKDYILKGRKNGVVELPESEDHVFLKSIAPYDSYKTTSSICSIYKSRRIFAGFTSNNGIHGLRRSVGHDMLASGNSVEQIAQVLGHRDIDSTKQYLSIDTEGLKNCTLDLSGIEVNV